jgi:hypothetical protein
LTCKCASVLVHCNEDESDDEEDEEEDGETDLLSAVELFVAGALGGELEGEDCEVVGVDDEGEGECSEGEDGAVVDVDECATAGLVDAGE